MKDKASSRLTILFLDDEDFFRETMCERLSIVGEVIPASTKDEALRAIKSHKIDLAFIDLNLHGKFEGMDVAEYAIDKGIYTVILTAHSKNEIIGQASEIGCQDFYIKGDEDTTIADVLARFYKERKKFQYSKFIERDFVTKDPETVRALEMVLSNSENDYPILITGETGTGKTRLAEKLHKQSGRTGRLIQINCKEISEGMFQSEMFGHTKGAFTGSTSSYEGKIKAAHKGTLFIDEICSIPMDVQTKLLKVIEEKRFYPVGSTKEEYSDFRLITASQNGLMRKIERGEFRFDLYQRLNFIHLNIKPLRERRCDILPLIEAISASKRKMIFSDETLQALTSYSWPGNIRELDHVVKKLKSLRKLKISPSDLPNELTAAPKERHDHILNDEQFELLNEIGFHKFMQEVEAEIFARKLKANDENVRTTINWLKVGNTRFYTSLKRNSLSEANLVH